MVSTDFLDNYEKNNRDSHITFFLLLHKNICCGYSLEAPQWGVSNEYQQHMFSWRNKKKISVIFSWKKCLWKTPQACYLLISSSALLWFNLYHSKLIQMFFLLPVNWYALSFENHHLLSERRKNKRKMNKMRQIRRDKERQKEIKRAKDKEYIEDILGY